jgi:hypothetical protein
MKQSREVRCSMRSRRASRRAIFRCRWPWRRAISTFEPLRHLKRQGCPHVNVVGVSHDRYARWRAEALPTRCGAASGMTFGLLSAFVCLQTEVDDCRDRCNTARAFSQWRYVLRRTIIILPMRIRTTASACRKGSGHADTGKDLGGTEWVGILSPERCNSGVD